MSVDWGTLHRAHLHRWCRTLSYGPSLFQNVLFSLPSVFRLPYLISINCSHLATSCVRDHHIPPIGKILPVFADTTLPSFVFQSGSYHLDHLCSSALIYSPWLLSDHASNLQRRPHPGVLSFSLRTCGTTSSTVSSTSSHRLCSNRDPFCFDLEFPYPVENCTRTCSGNE